MSGVSLSAGLQGGGGVSQSVAVLLDEKAQGTAGGSFASGAKRTRALNKIDSDPDSIIVSLSSNQFTLAAGTYVIEAWCAHYNADRNKAFIENITDTETTIGNNTRSNTTGGGPAYVTGVFEISANTVFEIQHQCTGASGSFGIASNFTGIVEVYCQVLVRKIA